MESIELVDWGVIGKVEETEVDTGQDTDQNDVGLIEEGREDQVEDENRHRGERNTEGVREGFVEGFV